MRKREHDTFSKVLEFFLIWYLLKLVVTRKHYIQNTAQKMKFSIKDFFSKRDQIRRKLRIWSHLMTKSLKESFIFCAVQDFDKIDTCCSLNFNKLPG